jgi:DNA-binding beta-propeller fold protein YncE
MRLDARSLLNALTILAAALAAPAFGASYEVQARYPIGGEGGWDYLQYDAGTQHLFIARGTHVQVVDPSQGKVIGDVPDTPGVHGVAIATGMDKAYASNGRGNSITVFSPSTLKTLAHIDTPAGLNPDFIAYDPVTRQVLAFNGRSQNASVIDAATDKLVKTIALKGKPEAAVADGQGAMFVDIEDANELQKIDLRSGAVSATWKLAGCDEPAGLAIDTATQRLFVGCHNKAMLVLDAASGKLLATLPIGEGVDANGFDAERKLAFSSQGDGTLTLVHEDTATHFTVQQTVATQAGARTMTLNPQTHQVYLVTAEFDEAPAAAGEKRGKRTMKPGSFTLLVVGEKGL